MLRRGRCVAWAAYLAACACLVGPASGQGHRLRGYAKNSAFLVRFPASQREALNTTRARMKLRWFASPRWTLAADSDLAFTGGSPLDEAAVGTALTSRAAPGQWADLTQVLADGERLVARHTLDRLFAEYYASRFVLTVGRQRVAWGVSDVFRPLDQFAPFAPAEVDREERVGIDAVRVSVPWGRLSSVEMIYSPQAGGGQTRLGTRARTHVGACDVGIVAGRFEGGDVLGGSFAADAVGAGVRGELLAVRHGYRRTTLVACTDFAGPCAPITEHGSYVKATLGATYGFRWRSLTVGGEAYYDASGERGEAGYDWIGVTGGRRLTLARRYLTATATALAHPLVSLAVTALVNADDGSGLIQPAVAWDAGQSVSCDLGAQWFTGGGGTEFGVRGDGIYSIYSIVAWHF